MVRARREPTNSEGLLEIKAEAEAGAETPQKSAPRYNEDGSIRGQSGASALLLVMRAADKHLLSER